MLKLDKVKIDRNKNSIIDTFYKEITLLREELDLSLDDDFDFNFLPNLLRKLREFNIDSDQPDNLDYFTKCFDSILEEIIKNFYISPVLLKSQMDIKKLDGCKGIINKINLILEDKTENKDL